MKRIVSVFLMLCMLLSTVGAAAAENVPQVFFEEKEVTLNGGNSFLLKVTVTEPFKEETEVKIVCEETGESYAVTFPGGQNNASAEIPTEKVQKRTNLHLRFEESAAYTIGKNNQFKVSLYTQPIVTFYLDVYPGYVGESMSVIVKCKNASSVLKNYNVFQLRDETGRVYAEKAWKNPSQKMTFKFDVTEDMTGRHDFTVWCGDICVSKAGYAAITDLNVPVLKTADVQEKYMAVTIDCAYFEEQTDAILDVLDKYDVKSTFFMTGYFMRTFTDSARKIVARGHEVGNHSSTHPHLPEIRSAHDVLRQIQRPVEDAQELLGVRPRLFRPPYGAYNKMITAMCRAEGQEVVMWTIDSHDWDENFKHDPDKVYSRVTKEILPGTVILFHLDGFNTPYNLDRLIPYFQNELGMKLVTVSELLELSGHELPPVFEENK